MNIAFSQKIRTQIPAIKGPLEYRIHRDLFVQIDHILESCGLEEAFLLKSIDNDESRAGELPSLLLSFRTMILYNLFNESCRKLSFRIADSSILQWFLKLDHLTGVMTPGKTFINDSEKMWAKEEIDDLIHALNLSMKNPDIAARTLYAQNALDFSEFYADTTCLQANIHHPVDWLLFRDCVRTLIKAINCIRRHGLFHRIGNPDHFLTEMNQYSIDFTMKGRQKSETKKGRNKVFRKMRNLLKRVNQHGLRYHELLEKRWRDSDLSEKQAKQILLRISNITDQVDEVIRIAETRILKEKKVKGSEKIISLYEKNVQVIVRGKMGANVEFGNVFYLAEQADGLIVDWDFFTEKSKGDAVILPESIARLEKQYAIKSITTDRGFQSEANSQILEQKNIYDATCPRSVPELRNRLEEDRFCECQKRRAQTEARIAIIKRAFIGENIQRKGLVNRGLKVSCAIFVHNLRILAGIASENLKLQEDNKAA